MEKMKEENKMKRCFLLVLTFVMMLCVSISLAEQAAAPAESWYEGVPAAQ